MMKIFVAADHNGFGLKNQIVEYLQKQKYDVVDVGDNTYDPEDDFPTFAQRAVHALLQSEDPEARAILLCGGGQGMAMAANRFRGIRASVIWDTEEARITRNDNDSNVLALPSRLLQKPSVAFDIVETWLHAPFANKTRYIRRNNQLDQL
jgi:ribose 5-phosphate isomerase B